MYTGVHIVVSLEWSMYIWLMCPHEFLWSVVLKCHILNYTLHYSHRDNDDVEDLAVKRWRLWGKWVTNTND